LEVLIVINLYGRDFLTLQDYSGEEIMAILNFAGELKEKQKNREPHPLLQGRALGMIFQKPSTRTRVSFEVGMWQLGGQALFLSSQELQMGRGEPVRDTAVVLSRYLDGIMIRTFDQAEVEELAAHATIPVINGLTDLFHPCQALADMLTIKEKFGSLKGLKLAYVGDGNNMAHSLLIACSKLGLHISVGAPEKYQPNVEIVAAARENALQGGSSVLITTDPAEAVEDADIIYTDVWTSMGKEDEKAVRLNIFAPYQVNNELVKLARSEAIILHCLPAYRGQEITAEVLEGKQSAVWDQAENRLHAQKALMAMLMGN
jgi:ornithine carbamoyltransferase